MTQLHRHQKEKFFSFPQTRFFLVSQLHTLESKASPLVSHSPSSLFPISTSSPNPSQMSPKFAHFPLFLNISLHSATTIISYLLGLPWCLRGSRICLKCKRSGFDPWVGKIPWGKEWLLTPLFLPGEFHGQRILAGYGPWCCKESDTTKWLTRSLTLVGCHFHHQPLSESFSCCFQTVWGWVS